MKKEDEKLLDRAKDRFKILHDAEVDIKEEFVKDMKFAYNINSGQWDQRDIDERSKGPNPRPYLSMNKLSKFVALVVNSEKGQPNLDEIIPVDDKGDRETALVYNELINHIEYQSEAEEVYAIAGEHAVAGGFGYWRVLTEYCDDGFDQDIKLKAIKNPLMVSLDPRGEFGFIREVIPTEEFEAKWPKAEVIDFEAYQGFDDWELWYQDEKVFIAEYFEKVPTTKEIVEFLNPETGEKAVVERTKENSDILDNFEITRTRKVDTHKVMWYKISGHEILEKGEWPGKDIPIVEVTGQEVWLEGKTYKKSLITDAKDAQRTYNYWLTSLTEKVALSPKAPYMVTQQQINGFEDMWDEANVKNFPYLLYNPAGGGMPQRTPPPTIDGGAMTMLQISDGNIKDILGMYESSMGMPSNERSGKAIAARAARSDLGTFSFQDNLRKAKQKTKKMLIDLIPKIYDTERVIRLKGTDQVIKINFNMMVEGGQIIKMHDLSKGRYDLRVRSFMTPSRRQQTLDNITQAMQYAPQAAIALLPLLLAYVDAPGSEEIKATIMQFLGQMQQQEAAEQGMVPEAPPGGMQ